MRTIFRNQPRLTLAGHLESQGERAVADAGHMRRHLDEVVQQERLPEVEVDLDARQPEIEPVEHLRVRQTHAAEQFRLRDLEETEKLAVVDDPGAVDVGPANMFFDRESFVHRKLRPRPVESQASP